MKITERCVSVDSLGLCEHCSVLLTLEDMPLEAINAELHCSSCQGVLSGLSFGYDEVDGKPERTRWVNYQKKWCQTRPTADFDLGNWSVRVRHFWTTFA